MHPFPSSECAPWKATGPGSASSTSSMKLGVVGGEGEAVRPKALTADQGAAEC